MSLDNNIKGPGFRQVVSSHQKVGTDISSLESQRVGFNLVMHELKRNHIEYPSKNEIETAILQAKEKAGKDFTLQDHDVYVQLASKSIFDGSGGVAPPKTENVQANIKNKIISPTMGGTSVQFLTASNDANLAAKEFCKAAVSELQSEFGKTTIEDYKQNPGQVKSTAIIPIDELHVTIIAMGVVDAPDVESYQRQLENSQYYRAVFEHFSERQIDSISFKESDNQTIQITKNELLNRVAVAKNPQEVLNLIEDKSIQEDIKKRIHILPEELSKKSENVRQVMDSGGLILDMIDIKITDNGSIVVQYASNDDLVQLKEGLVSSGGLAKGTLGSMTASTIGFIPNYDKITPEERIQLGKKISDLKRQIVEKKLYVVANDLTYVMFKVNTLGETIKREPLISGDKIFIDFQPKATPAQLEIFKPPVDFSETGVVVHRPLTKEDIDRTQSKIMQRVPDVYLGALSQENTAVDNLPLHVHTEGPKLFHHIAAMLHVLNYPDDGVKLSDGKTIPLIPSNLAYMREFLTNQDNKQDLEDWIIFHDLGKVHSQVREVEEEGHKLGLFLEHEERSFEICCGHQELDLDDLPFSESSRSSISSSIRHHGDVYKICNDKGEVNQPEFDKLVAAMSDEVGHDQRALEKALILLATGTLLDVSGTHRSNSWLTRPLTFGAAVAMFLEKGKNNPKATLLSDKSNSLEIK